MAKWVASSVLDNGLNQIKNNAIRMLLIKAYSAGDSYATVTNGSNVVVDITVASGDFVLGSAGNNRTLTVASGKNGSALISTLAGDDLHVAFTNNVDTVYWVTDANNQAITSGNTVTLGEVVYTAQQPT